MGANGKKETNPVIEIYRGQKIHKYNTIQIRVNPFEFKQFINAKLDHNMTPREAIHYRKALCNICDHFVKKLKP